MKAFFALLNFMKREREIPWISIILAIIVLVLVIIFTDSFDWLFKKEDEYGYPF